MNSTERRLKEFQDMKFGMFIHWGLYSEAGGEWNGKRVRGIGEWLMAFEKIPVVEYATLANRFNPVKYNADEWAQLAQDAGMKYLVITSKHHEGFAMYDSKACDYNIVNATPYGKDPMRPLSKACAKRDIKFGFYYSQALDWHEPEAHGNDWDFPKERDPAPYVNRKLLPQVREILSNYGDLSLVWFDTPILLTKEQVIELRSTVKELQPNCLVNSRIGYDQGDFDQVGDNSIPTQVLADRVWEAPATLNATWGYKKDDHAWVQPRGLVCEMADVVSKGGNFLLNIGPDGEGVVPAESQKILRRVGEWMAVNGESIYGTSHSPFNINQITWRCTVKPGKLYIHVVNWSAGGLEIPGLKTLVQSAHFLDGGAAVPFKQADGALRLDLPELAPDPFNTVIVLDLEDEVAEVEEAHRYDYEPTVRYLHAWEARMRGEEFHYDAENQAAYNFIDGTRPRNELRWYMFPQQNRNYTIDIEYACDNEVAGSPFYLCSREDEWEESTEVNAELTGVIEGTGGEFVTRRLGTMDVFAPKCTLIFGLKDDFRSVSVKVRRLILTAVV
jgi:alpha-L-fucosidase